MPPSASSMGSASVAPFLPTPATDQFHELRVRIPTDVHRQLLALKILRGVTLAQTVVVALDRYFAARDMSPPEPEEAMVAKSP